MIKIREKHKNIISDYIEDIEVFISSDDLEGLLLEIDDAIIGCIENDEPNSEGVKLQQIYDEIYEMNLYN